MEIAPQAKKERETVDGKHKTGGCGMAFGRGRENEETTESSDEGVQKLIKSDGL